MPSDGGAYGKSGSCFIQRGAGDAKTKSETLFRHVGDGGMGKGKYKGEQARLGVGTKKLIVSRQPIFTNLKSNTMKNIANIRGSSG